MSRKFRVAVCPLTARHVTGPPTKSVPSPAMKLTTPVGFSPLGPLVALIVVTV